MLDYYRRIIVTGGLYDIVVEAGHIDPLWPDRIPKPTLLNNN
jgi:hypothetical protein